MAVFKQVLMNEGEGIEALDLQNAQQFALSGILETFVGRIGLTNEGIDETAQYNGLQVLGGDCQPLVSATALRMSPRAGLLLFPDAGVALPTPTGNESKVIPHWASAAELQTDHVAGHASLPRWDTVSVSLSWQDGEQESRDFKDAVTGALSTATLDKRRRPVLIKTLTAGTPDANPLVPDPPVGSIALYSVYVPAALSGVFLQSNVIDWRCPIGAYTEDVYAADVWNRGAFTGTWTRIAGGGFAAMSAGGAGDTLLFVPSGIRGNQARLVGVGVLMGDISGTSSFAMYRLSGSGYGTTGGGVLLGTVSGLNSAATAGNTGWKRSAPAGLVQNAASSLWVNGWGCPISASEVGGVNGFTRLGMRFQAGGAADRISMVRFYFSGGL